MHKLSGHCPCKNVEIEVTLSESPENYQPRKCDCEFCTEHDAAYVSDPAGALKLTVKDKAAISKHKNGSETAEFLVCENCENLVGVKYNEGEKTFAAVNSNLLTKKLGKPVVVSPKKLQLGEKIKRWKDAWFSDVDLDYLDF